MQHAECRPDRASWPLALAWRWSPLPAAAADKEHQQMMADIRMLQEQAQQLQNLLGALNEALKAVNARSTSRPNANRKAFADQKLGHRHAVERSARRPRKGGRQQRPRRLAARKLDALRQSVQQLQRRAAGRPRRRSGAAAPAVDRRRRRRLTAGAAAVGASPQKLFDSALADYYAGQYDLAILGFEAYIKTLPAVADRPTMRRSTSATPTCRPARYDKAVEAYDTGDPHLSDRATSSRTRTQARARRCKT